MWGILIVSAIISLSGCAQCNKHTANECLGAVYFSTNEERENFVISNKILADGSLRYASAFSTGGRGSFRSGSRSSDTLRICGQNLFVVNPGSHTVTMFAINPQNPVNLKFITQVGSRGEAPSSLACSTRFKVLCVLNSGAVNGVACFTINNSSLVFLPKTLKSLGLTLPPLLDKDVVTIRPSDIQFTPDLKFLVISIKGDKRTGPRGPGSVAVFKVLKRGQKLGKLILNKPVGLVPYSLTLIPGTGKGTRFGQSYVFTDIGDLTPKYGIGLFELETNGRIKSGSIVESGIPGNVAACWAQFSPSTGNVFVTDYVASLLNELRVNIGPNGKFSFDFVKQYKSPASVQDLVIVTLPSGEFMYILNPGVENAQKRGVEVYKIEGPGKAVLIQEFVPPMDDIVAKTGVWLNGALNGLEYFLAINPTDQ